MVNQKTFKKGQILSKQGDFELFMYIIKEGKVGVYLEYGTPEQRLVEIDSAPDGVAGENGMFLSKPRYATFVALEDTNVDIVTLDTISEYFEGKQSKIVEMMQHMCEKNEHLSEVFGDACRAMADYIRDNNAKKKPGLLGKINSFLSLDKHYNSK